ncbi:MAG: hypothetical protein LBR54_03740 [Oscillospiraceae bacterium]|nr:hypothetical protein [Oscillospiraceae bacterium]
MTQPFLTAAVRTLSGNPYAFACAGKDGLCPEIRTRLRALVRTGFTRSGLKITIIREVSTW